MFAAPPMVSTFTKSSKESWPITTKLRRKKKVTDKEAQGNRPRFALSNYCKEWIGSEQYCMQCLAVDCCT